MMIRVLVDNESSSGDIKSEHGLSLLLELQERKILFDFGQGEQFAANAERMGADLSEVDYAILSHGHYDHGGGLNHFLKINTTAPVYVRDNASDQYYAKREGDVMEYIGLPAIDDEGRLILTGMEHQIEEGITLFSVPPNPGFEPSGNRVLFEKLVDGRFTPDSFLHEQNLLINREGVTLLVTGCAHRGIINILEWVRKKYGIIPQNVIGGFHLRHVLDDEETEAEAIRGIAEYLCETGAKYYTGHCTGLAPCMKLKEIMREHIEYASAGSILAIT